jgi:hypothetical protein
MDEREQMDEVEELYQRAVRESVELGNRIADEEPEADIWDISDGLLAGAIHFWLYTRQPVLTRCVRIAGRSPRRSCGCRSCDRWSRRWRRRVTISTPRTTLMSDGPRSQAR